MKSNVNIARIANAVPCRSLLTQRFPDQKLSSFIFPCWLFVRSSHNGDISSYMTSCCHCLFVVMSCHLITMIKCIKGQKVSRVVLQMSWYLYFCYWSCHVSSSQWWHHSAQKSLGSLFQGVRWSLFKGVFDFVIDFSLVRSGWLSGIVTHWLKFWNLVLTFETLITILTIDKLN